MNSSPAKEEDIHAAYRFILDRDVDAEGLRHYLSRIADGLTTSELRDALMGSPEFNALRNKTPVPRAVEIAEGLYVSVDTSEPEFGTAIACEGTWEPHIVQTIVANLKQGDTFVDVGSNVGIMSFHAARAVGPKGTVIAFEPNPDNAARYIEGINLNGFKHVILLRLALSNENAIVGLSGGSNTAIDITTDKLSVQAIPGDTLLLGRDRIDFVKLDIEGFEPFALQGMSLTLQRHRPKILCEFNPRCLRSHARYDPEIFAADIFRLTTGILAIEHDGTSHKLQSAAALLSLWESENTRAISQGRLPDGMLHFDLLFRIDAI